MRPRPFLAFPRSKGGNSGKEPQKARLAVPPGQPGPAPGGVGLYGAQYRPEALVEMIPIDGHRVGRDQRLRRQGRIEELPQLGCPVLDDPRGHGALGDPFGPPQARGIRGARCLAAVPIALAIRSKGTPRGRAAVIRRHILGAAPHVILRAALGCRGASRGAWLGDRGALELAIVLPAELRCSSIECSGAFTTGSYGMSRPAGLHHPAGRLGYDRPLAMAARAEAGLGNAGATEEIRMKKRTSVSRREFNALASTTAAATLGMMGATRMAAAQSPASPLESRFLMELLLDVDQSLDAGHTRIAPVTGGTFSGPRLKGTVHGGADWITQVSGRSSLDVRITLETDDGVIIYMTYKGMVVPGDDGVYWRVTPVFSTSSETYDWLNHRVFVGKSKQAEGKVAYDIFEIL